MADLELKYFPEADAATRVYSFSDTLREEDGSATQTSVTDSRFVLSSLSGTKLKSFDLGSIQWDDTNKLLSIQIANGDLTFANRDMEVTYNWWVELADGRAVPVAEGRALIERGAA